MLCHWHVKMYTRGIMKMYILVTGGAGFIGSHIVEYHLAKGDRVQVVDNLSTGSMENIRPFFTHKNFKFDQANILTWPALDRAVARAERIYHMAAVVGMHLVLAEPVQVLATNIAGCERVLRAVHTSARKPQVIIASSSEVYGTGQQNDFNEDGDLVIKSGARSRWNYAISKLADEALGLSYARHYDLQITPIRFFNTIGPRQTGRYGMVVPRFVDQAVKGLDITVHGNGLQTRSFCDVRDTVIALDLLASNPDSKGEIVNVGNDREITIAELAEMVRTRAHSPSTIKFVPYQEAYGEDHDEVRYRKPDLRKLHELTGFTAARRLEETLDELIGAYDGNRFNNAKSMG